MQVTDSTKNQVLQGLRFARKPMHLREVVAEAEYGDDETCVVEKTVQLTPAEFEYFSANLGKSYLWLTGTGGRRQLAGYTATLVVHVHNGCGQNLYVNAEGCDYPRYVAIQA